MNEIQIAEHGVYKKIAKPSGPKATATKLMEGKSYLYYGMYKYRTILELDGDRVLYQEMPSGWIWSCSKAHFARKCPNEATEKEITFINTQ